MKILLLSLFLSRVSAEMQSVQHSMYVSRKSRSNSQPIETSYTYSHYNNEPAITYSSQNNYKSRYSGGDMMDKHRNPSNQYSNYYNSSPSKYSEHSVPISVSNHIISGPPVTEPYIEPVTKFDLDYEKSKSEAEFNSKYIPAKLKSDFIYSEHSVPISVSKHVISGPPVTEPYIEPVTKLDVDYEKSKSEAKFNSKYIPAKLKSDLIYSEHSVPISISNHVISGPPVTEPYIEPVTKLDIDYEKSKSEAEFNSKYIPAKLKSDLMYEKLKSYMHYNPPDGYKFNDIGYDMGSDYHVDDDDIRTSSRTSYDGWPYYFHSPYEYEIHKMDSEIEKAKDKRYASDKSRVVIPVYETIENDIPNYNKPKFLTTTYNYEVTTDNPVHGDKPFISYVLNDNFDRNYDDDPVVFKGFDYGKDFDFEGSPGLNMDDYIKRKRRVEYDDSPSHYVTPIQSNRLMDDVKKIEGDSFREKGHTKKQDFDKKEKKKEEKETYKKGIEKSNNGYTGFKNFADVFANKFSAEGHKKDSKYELKNNADNGESRRGFRRVYHKDEYQEDNEFYDNKNNSARATEKGTAFNHGKGSEGFIKSHSTANTGNESNALSEARGTEGNKFDNSHRGHDYSHGYDNDFNRYRDVGKKASQSNSADYDGHYIV